MQGGNEDLTQWHDFHARQYDAALGRWFGVDALGYKMPGMSPYNGMANNPIMFIDPDGNEPVTFLAKLVIYMLKGAGLGGGIMGGAYTASAALSQGGLRENWQWSQFGKSVGNGAMLGAMAGGAKVFGKLGPKGIKELSNVLGGGVNMRNYHDPGKGFGWHSFGYFAAGYLGSWIGLNQSMIEGIGVGGILNTTAGLLAGDINKQNSYGLAQHFVGGGLSAVAGKNFYSSAGKTMGLKKAANYVFGDALVDKAVSYGLQNIASNFAFDRSQTYFDRQAGLKIGGSFLIGAFGGLGQYGIMKGGSNFSDFRGYSALFAKSTFAYFGEYSANNLWNTGNRYPSYRSYHRYKMASFGVKSMFYTFINW